MNKYGSKLYYDINTLEILWETGDRAGINIEDVTDEFNFSLSWAENINKENISILQTKYGEIRKGLEENEANSYRLKKNKDKVEIEYYFDKKKEENRPKSEVEELKKELEKTKLEYAASLAEIIEKTEKDKLELSTAIVELMEQSIK